MTAKIARILTFRASAADLEELDRRYLLVGLLVTWLVGIGRYWDNPRASLFQHAGAGSVVYVFALSALLFVVGIGLRPERWSYRNLLTFVTLTAFPGLIYAVPVERFLSPEAARTANVWFLGVVASWRMALYGIYLRRYARMAILPLVVQLLFPVVVILVALTALNLEHAVFDIMGGIQRETTSADAAYAVVVGLTLVSVVIAPVLILVYLVLAWRAWTRGRGRGSPGERP